MPLTLSDCYKKNNILLPKYPEPLKDSSNKHKYNFLAANYSATIIHTEAARILPVIWDTLGVLIEEWAIVPSMLQYYQDTYPETFYSKNIIKYTWKGYYDIIKSIKEKTLVVLHPYGKIDEDIYYIDPDLLCFLNDKSNLKVLSSSIAKAELMDLNLIKNLRDFPFVLKAHSGASWDGVRIIKNISDLKAAVIFFQAEDSLLVEEFIDIKDNKNIQVVIYENGNYDIIGISNQYTTKEGEYDGNIIYKDTSINSKIKTILNEICSNAYKLWFQGIAGFDIVRDSNNKYIFMDPNFRLNGSTSTLMLRDRIFTERDAQVLLFGSFKSNYSDIKTMIQENQKLGNKSLYILSSYQEEIAWVIWWYAVMSSKNEATIEEDKRMFEKLWFKL